MGCTDQNCARRAFLVKSIKSGAAICGACIFPASVLSCLNNPKDGGSPDYYYTSQKEKLLKEYDKDLQPGQAVLIKALGESLTRYILMDARKEYQNIIPEIPYIGGDENENSTSQLLGAAQYFAVYRTLVANGKDLKEIGQLIYDMFEARLQSSPQMVVRIYGYFKYHVGWSEKIKKYSAMSQKRKYPMDFVYTFIEGEGKNFDYGTDMTECSIQKFYRKQKAEELVPYMCALDYPLSRRFNRGLVRTQTLVESDVCDFRYKKDRQTRVNLTPGLKA